MIAVGFGALAGCSAPGPVVDLRDPAAPDVFPIDRGAARWQGVGRQLAREILDNRAAWGKLPARPSVAVMPLSSESQSTTQLGVVLAGGIETALLDANCLRLVDRRSVDQVLREQDLCLALSDSQVSRVGKAISADVIITGTLTVAGGNLVGEARLTSVPTGELLAKATFEQQVDARTSPWLMYVQRPSDKGKIAGELPPLTLYYDILAQRQTAPGRFDEILVREGTALRSAAGPEVRRGGGQGGGGQGRRRGGAGRQRGDRDRRQGTRRALPGAALRNARSVP